MQPFTSSKIVGISLVLLVALLLSFANSCTVGRLIVYNFADIRDYKKFPERAVRKGTNTFEFAKTENGKSPKSLTANGKKEELDAYLSSHKTVAFLIIKDDSIQYEKYFAGYGQASIVPSFSMAKSVTSILIGCAVDDGLIKSVQQPVTDFIPELKKNGFEKVSIEHLLQMTSGLKFNEGYANPFGEVATFYYGKDLRRAISKLKLKAEPGKGFEYVSGNPQLLGLVLERALLNKSVSQYLEEKIWKPLGMEYDAGWSLDSKNNGLEKTFCCINAHARDFAKIGRLYLNKGNWNGTQIVSRSWVEQSTKIDTINGSTWFYQYQWWLPTRNGDFMAQGILGQFVYVNPAKKLIIVRLGSNVGGVDWPSVFVRVAAGY